MPKARRLQSNFSKGELSPLLYGRPELAAYFEGAEALTNAVLLRQGGVRRRTGTRLVWPAKNAASPDTMLWPFIVNTETAYILEIGHQYIRVFYSNGTPVVIGATQVEIVTPYQQAEVPDIHIAQSADVLYLWHGAHPTHKLSHVSATQWALTAISYNPPAVNAQDATFAATLVYTATTGTGIRFLASAAVFLAADVGRAVIAGAGWGDITAVVSPTEATVDIIDPFDSSALTTGPGVLSTLGIIAGTSAPHGLAMNDYIVIASGAQTGEIRRVIAVDTPTTFLIDAIITPYQNGVDWKKHTGIAPGSWGLRLAPQTTLNPNKGKPVGAIVTLVAGADAFRAEDVGKYITIWGGLVKVTEYVSATTVKGKIIETMVDTTDPNPDAVDPGGWTLESPAWTADRGYPRTGGFFQGRLAQAGTAAQPTTFWLSESDDFEGYSKGAAADFAIEYTVASRQVNQIEWLGDGKDLFLGTSGAEVQVKGDRNGDPLGGDHIPLVDVISPQGSAHVQPVILDQQMLFLGRDRRKLFTLSYDLNRDAVRPNELTALAEHLAGDALTTFRPVPMAMTQHPDPRVAICRSDGVLVFYTYFPDEKVMGFSTFTTDGDVESVAVIPNRDGQPDALWMVVKRTINGQTVRYIEMVDDGRFRYADPTLRPWPQLMTDCAVTYTGGVAITQMEGLGLLEGATVDVIADGSYRGTRTVSGGVVDLGDPALVVEVGLHYDTTIRTMRPAIEGSSIEGLPRSWDTIGIRLHKTRGGRVNGEWLSYAPNDLDEVGLFTGDRIVTGQGWDTDGRITIEQTQPYPMTVLAVYGELSVGDRV